MANRIKGITVKINGDTTNLSDSLAGLDKDIKNTQSQLKDVEKLLKLDPTNTELLAQKQRLLGEAINDTKDRLETLKTASEKAAQTKDNYDDWKAKYDPIKKEIDETSEKLKKLKEQSEKAAETAENYDEWKTKYEPIQKEIDETQTKLKNLKEQAKRADEQLANGEISQEKYDNLQREIGETSDKLKNLKQDAKNVSEEFGNPISPEQYDALQQEIKDTSGKLENLRQDAKKVSDEFGNPVSPEQFDSIQREIIETEQELQNLQREAENSRTALVKIGKAGESLQNVGGKISGVGEKLLPVTAGILGLGTVGASNFAEVDKIMQLANKTMENTVEEAETLNIVMKDAASNSTYGMNDAANAVLNFARAGLDAKQSAATLAPAMNLAAGEGGDLNTVSAGLVATLNGFHASFEEAENYADIFAAACNNSALDINSLSDSMSVAAPIFSAAGYNVKDAALAMGLMGNAGIEATVSANSLKTGLARLASASDDEVAFALIDLGFKIDSVAENEDKLRKAQNELEEKTASLTAKQLKYNEVLKKYGEGSSQVAEAQARLTKAQNDFEQAQSVVNGLTQEGSENASVYGALLVDDKGKMKPFVEVIKSLQSAFSGLSEQEQISAAATIFGKNQMAPWLALINTAPEDLDELSTSLNDCTGITQEMADTMMGGFGGGIEKLKSSIDVLIYSIGESLAPILQKAIDFIQALVDKFNALSPQIKETIVKIGLIVATIGPLLILIGKLTTGIGGMMIVFSKIPAVITKIKNGFIAVKT
ncbi:MAG: phage tail tape measure protein, partial [Oscillospiraceae bacterium]|nr:phage tail tape measure protein [Oscillospiraceae bacterium]